MAHFKLELARRSWIMEIIVCVWGTGFGLTKYRQLFGFKGVSVVWWNPIRKSGRLIYLFIVTISLPAAVQTRQVGGDVTEVESSEFHKRVTGHLEIWHHVLLKERTNNLWRIWRYPLVNWVQSLKYLYLNNQICPFCYRPVWNTIWPLESLCLPVCSYRHSLSPCCSLFPLW